ncbi:MAG: chromosome segregation protein SMC [Spirochaetes bacterium GWD1_61_31]|nr:MAG: chromosome segregation protein SMC [Spirochaetes bacterium GWB1_60_80]OHD33452.1 MAG: chromosome segregation protein SMC [Spirochaetes bacterium GWC1_61_12]OHD40581.1 MAG: chromosome segregation protein SMC [Spirochaetes bacterium GWD1_61_31]OHD59288.1 MAG: chromosome segregation protein SMC [Spirochaetes bacterium GWF1_60_12]
MSSRHQPGLAEPAITGWSARLTGTTGGFSPDLECEVMMFLKSLEIFGFKSFADRTRVEFSEGISALLGPNGCGKSNVVDAIKWVVGEQSARSLRADTMESIIFNGTESRKALNIAEVTLTISNEKGVLLLDMPEIAIKRRLYRSGESEYFINNQPAKLKELRELFWDTGIGKSAYSVMEQGRIDQILSSKPEERRYLFEEAAGITKHKARSREAEIKLERTEENMRQVDGILGEVKRSHDSLKSQSEKTLAYRSLREQVFNAELDLHLIRLRGFVNDKERRDTDLAAKTKDRDQLKAAIDGINLSLEENLDIVNSMEAKLVDVQKTVYGLAVERAGKEKERKLLNERVQEAKAKIDQAGLKLRALAEKLEGLREDEDEKNDILRNHKTRLAEVEKNIQGFEGNIKAAEQRIHDNEAAIRSAEADTQACEADLLAAQADLDAITEDIVRELDARLKDSAYSAQERHAAEATIEQLIDGIITRLSGKAAILEDLAGLKDYATDKAQALVASAAAAMVEATEQARQLRERYLRYRDTSPTFIDEFLSPEGIITKKRQLDERMGAIKLRIQANRDAIQARREENRELAVKIDEYRRTLEELRGNRIRLQTQAQAAEESLAMIRREIASQEAYYRELDNEVSIEKRRLADAEEDLGSIDEDIAGIEKKGRELTAELERLEKDIAIKNSDVGKRQDELRKKIERLGVLQTELERLHLGLAQTETEIRNVKDNFKEQYGRDLLEFEERMYEIRVAAAELREKLAVHKQKLKDLGSVNLMAPEEFAEVKERYEFLSGQMADLQKARDDLKRITQEIRDESAEMFLNTYNRVKKNFHNMFRRLFGGGRGELRLSDPDHVLESGIEIYAQPPGKKLETIGLLSGGEKSLTAIALLFATYMVRPSPFCFLDEIDAALDEQNVIRFVNLLREFGKSSQFIVITHNKKTVTGADALLGVTMEESGITKVIAVRLTRSDGEAIHVQEPLPDLDDEEVEIETGRELPPTLAAETAAAAAAVEPSVAMAEELDQS